MQSFSTPVILLFWGLFVPALSLGQSLTFDQLLSLRTKPWTEINTTLTAKGWELSSSKNEASRKEITWSYGETPGYGDAPIATAWFNWYENTNYGASINYQTKKEIFTVAKSRANAMGFKPLDSKIDNNEILEIVGGTQTVIAFTQSVENDEKNYSIFLMPYKHYYAIKLEAALQQAWMESLLSGSNNPYSDSNTSASVTSPSSPLQQTLLDEIARSMVRIPGGLFLMGSFVGVEDEEPVHSISVNSFYLSSTEVTQGQYNSVMGTNPSGFQGCDQCPVEMVNWEDAQEFIQRLNQLTGKIYRLPTEAEWECAAGWGDGMRTKTWAGTSSESGLDGYAWYEGNSGGKTHPVKSKNPNSLGLYDMSGNVWEWCQDSYSETYYQNSPYSNPLNSAIGFVRVLRGGSWLESSHHCRISNRIDCNQSIRDARIGFRLAASKGQ